MLKLNFVHELEGLDYCDKEVLRVEFCIKGYSSSNGEHVIIKLVLTGDHASAGVWPVPSVCLCIAVAALLASSASPTPAHPYCP